MAPESLDPQLALPAGYPRAPTTSAHTYRLQIFKEPRVALTGTLALRSTEATAPRCLALTRGSLEELSVRREVKL